MASTMPERTAKPLELAREAARRASHTYLARGADGSPLPRARPGPPSVGSGHACALRSSTSDSSRPAAPREQMREAFAETDARLPPRPRHGRR